MILIFVIIGAIFIIKKTSENSFGYNNGFKISNAQKVDLDEIIKKNSVKTKYKEEKANRSPSGKTLSDPLLHFQPREQACFVFS